MSEIQNTSQEVLEKSGLISDQDIVGNPKILTSVISMVRRAEVASILNKQNFVISPVENGLGFFSEDAYNELVNNTIKNYSEFLINSGTDEETIKQNLDAILNNLNLLTIKYEDFTDEIKNTVISSYTSSPEPETSKSFPIEETLPKKRGRKPKVKEVK